MAIRLVAALVFAGAATISVQDDAQINGWIADLMHSDPAKRAEAEKSLVKAGPKALPALKLATESKTTELATRAKAVVAEIERIEFEKKHDATQRPRRLEIVTLQVKDATLGDVLKALGQQVDSTFHATVDAKQKLTIDVKDVPVRKCLDQIEEALKATVVSKYNWHRVQAGAPAKRKRAYAPGATFDFSLEPFKVGDAQVGWAMAIEQTGTATVVVESIEVADAQKSKVEVQRCGRCAPRYSLLKTDKKGPFTVKLKGRLVWESPYEQPLIDPAKPQAFKVGTFAIKYEWPKVTWTSSEPVAARLIGRAELAGKLKNQPKSPGSGAMGVGIVPPPPRAPNTWCACPAGPSPMPPAQEIKLTSGSYYEAAFRTLKPEVFESMKVRFFKGIEEAFEAEAVVE
jgi:hypothetical protein